MNVTTRQFALICLLLFIFAVFIQFYALRSNPPGFFLDESSIAYNAYKIATTGKDEHGEAFPLFFRAFGEYKNPVYIYLLAAIYRVTGPSCLAARALSTSAGLLTALLLGLLALQITKNRLAGILFAACGLLTPWLFELSRLALEVALYPFAVAFFLLAVWKASIKPKWGIAQICWFALTLALLTYTYSIGRLHAPLLALGLILFATRKRLPAIVLTWIAFGITLIPLLVFQQHHPSALTSRFKLISFVTPESSWTQTMLEFGKHLFSNLNPWRLFVSEHSRVSEIVHIPGPPAMLTITALLVVSSLWLLIRRKEIDAWWRFVIFGVIASVVPASLTVDNFHMLRLAPLPVFLLTLTIPTFQWLTSDKHRQSLLYVALLLIFLEGIIFQVQYQRSASSPRRLHTFDADYPTKILPSALEAAGAGPIYLADNPGRPAYVQAYWYALLQEIPAAKFVDLGFEKAPPENAVVITTESPCLTCRVLAESEPYATYIAKAPSTTLVPIAEGEMNAEISMPDPPNRLHPGQQIEVEITVRNMSHTIWPAGDRSLSPLRVTIGNHWLDLNGQTIVNDDGRGPLNSDLHPGETRKFTLTINAPRRTGECLLEIDLLQEGVSWFGLKGSKTWRSKVTIE